MAINSDTGEKEKDFDVHTSTCVVCGSTNMKPSIREASGWAFFDECGNCGEKHYWAVNDMMSGALHPYSLLEHGKEWMLDFHINKVHLILEEAERGWENKNGQNYSNYDRRKHTAAKLLATGLINL